jgi:transposase-like protein
MEKQVLRKKRQKRQHTTEFKQEAVARMQSATNISRLAEELGIERAQLYDWESALAGNPRIKASKRKGSPLNSPGETEEELRAKIRWLEEALARQMAERDFFKGALQRIEARRQNKDGSGNRASMTKSEN